MATQRTRELAERDWTNAVVLDVVRRLDHPPEARRAHLVSTRQHSLRIVDRHHLVIADRTVWNRTSVDVRLGYPLQDARLARRLLISRPMVDQLVFACRAQPGVVQNVKHLAATFVGRTVKDPERPGPGSAGPDIVSDSIPP